MLLLPVIASVAVGQRAPTIPPAKGPSELIRLFNGENLDGWVGHENYWSVEDGEIVGRNTEPVPVSTYLLTKRDFSDFRLLFEFKLVESEMHSGIALWGEVAPEKGDPHTYAGHLVMFPSNYGFWDLYGRNSIHDNAEAAKKIGKQHDWNRIEILAQGNRIRFVLNGELISDWREPEPERIQKGPIGLQLHSNKIPQEVRFRKLRLETFPEDRLVTLSEGSRISKGGVNEIVRTVDAKAPGIDTRFPQTLLPDSLLQPIHHPEFGLKTMGIRPAESDSYYAMLQKARELPLNVLHKAAAEFRDQRRQLKENEKYQKLKPHEFPSFVDLYREPAPYHGRLITLRGHIRKLIRVPADENPYGIEDLYEAWLYDRDAQENPAVILTTSIDERLELSTDTVTDHVYVSGYFFKNMGYEAQDVMRFAPVIIGQKLEYQPRDGAGNWWGLNLGAQVRLLIGLAIAFIATRFGYRLWKRSRVDDRQREAVKELVDSQAPEPSFDNISDNGGMPDFSSLETSESPTVDGEQ